MMLVGVTLLLLLPYTVVGLYSKKGPVIIAGRDEVKQLMQHPSPLFLEFFAPWCGHCKSLAPHYKAAAKKMAGLVNFAAVDCDVEKNKPLCGKFNVKGFPTIVSFGASKPGERKKQPSPYQQARTSAAIVKFAAGLITDVTKSVTASNIESLRGDKAALLFSDKKKVGVTAKGVALQFAGVLPFGIVHSAEKELVKEFSVTNFPTLVVLNGEADGKHVTYDGKLKAPQIAKFLVDFVDIKHQQHSSSDDDSEAPKSKPVVYDRELKVIETAEDWEADCGTGSGLCAIAFLDPDDGADRHARFVKVLEDLLEKHYKNIRFRWANGPEQYSAYESFGLGGGFPNIVLFTSKKGRSIPYRGPFALEEINTWINQALRGIAGGSIKMTADQIKFVKYEEDNDGEEDEEESHTNKEEL